VHALGRLRLTGATQVRGRSGIDWKFTGLHARSDSGTKLRSEGRQWQKRRRWSSIAREGKRVSRCRCRCRWCESAASGVLSKWCRSDGGAQNGKVRPYLRGRSRALPLELELEHDRSWRPRFPSLGGRPGQVLPSTYRTVLHNARANDSASVYGGRTTRWRRAGRSLCKHLWQVR
jgi:hypothetical protein